MPSLNTTAPKSRRGIAALELLLITPVFLLLITGLVGFADLLIAEQKMDEASGRVARIASMGGSEKQMREALVAVLGPERAKHAKITIRVVKNQNQDATGDPTSAPNGDPNGPNDGVPTTEAERPGNGDQDSGRHGHLDLLEVTVELDVGHATVTRLVPVSRNEKLIGRTVVQRQ